MNNNLEIVELNNRLEESYMSYAMATIIDRALPDVRDGLLPIHRRLLYAMYKAGLTYNKERAKSAEPVSETMKIHHHGDGSIYESLSLLTEQNETLLHPFLDGEGSFGKVYSTDQPSHMRYTYCRLNKFSEEMFDGLNKNIIKMVGEDEKHKQPVVLNCSYPSILVKPNKAIAVGESCTFGSFPLKEVCDTTIAYINNKDIDLIEYLNPDFSTGAYLIYNEQALRKIYETGKGSIILRSKYKFDKELSIIEIYEIPYSTTANQIIEEIKDIMPMNKDILDVRNENGFNKELNREELKISIDVRKNTNVENLMHKLFLTTSLQTAFSFNMNCLVNYEPMVMGIKPILDEWLKFRKECIIKSLKYDIENETNKLHMLTGLEKVLLDIDEAVNIIRNSLEDKIINNLCEKFGIDNEQADYISNIKLRNINKNYIIKQIKDIEGVRRNLKNLQNKLNSEDEINKIIISDLIRVRDTYGKPRKTEILYPEEIKQIDSNELIPDYSVTMVFTKEQYLKKTLRYADADKQKVKDGDQVLSIQQTNNRAEAILLSNLGNAYKLRINDLQEKQPSAMGEYLPSLLELEPNEQIIGMLSTSDFKGHAIIVYENGKIARIKMSKYFTKQKRSKLQNSLNLESPVVAIFQANEDIDILLMSNQNKYIVVNTKDVSEKTSRNTQGVTFMKSAKDDFKVIEAKLYDGSLDDTYRTNKSCAGKSV